MSCKVYSMRYSKGPVLFTNRPFTEEHIDEAYRDNFISTKAGYKAHLENVGIPEIIALLLVNKWNRQNSESGFTYWIE